MTREQMQDFARAWIAAWNRRDLEAVLAHFAEDAHFRSPEAQEWAVLYEGHVDGRRTRAAEALYGAPL